MSGAFLVGAKGFVDSGISFSKKIPIPERPPDAIEELKTLPNQAQIYRISGDYNPLHVDPEMAQMSGFKAPILHGLCSLGFSARGVLRAFAGNDPARFKALKLRFSKPVMPGQTLIVEMWNTGENRIVFRTKVKETGKVAINNAFMELHPGAKL